MKNILDINNLISSADIKEIASYCNVQEYDIELMKKEVNKLSIMIGNCISTKSNCGHFSVDMKNCENKGIILVFRFKINGVEDKAFMEVEQSGYERFISDFEKLVNIIVLGTKAVSELNSEIINIQNENSSSTMFYYSIGINNKSCEIANWDYDMIMVRLSKSSSIKLIDVYQSGELHTIINDVNWEMGLCEFIHKFNSLSISTKLEATLKSQTLEEMLLEHMISVDDMIALLGRGINADKMSEVSVVKTVCILKELGRFAVISDWKIDNKSKDVTVEITYNKILDLDTGKFVVDPGFVGRVRNRLLNNSNKIGEYTVKCVESR